MDKDSLTQLVRCYEQMLAPIKHCIDADGTAKTPLRAAKAFQFLTQGYHQNIHDICNQALFDSTNKNMVIVKNVEFYSLCEHHLLPFSGKVHVGYLPQGKVIGLSKIPRIIEMYARRLQIQENLCEQIASSLMDYVGASGVGVVISATHSCMCMRGVQKQSASMTTSSMLGVFEKNLATRQEFLQLLDY